MWKARAFNNHVSGIVADSSGSLIIACGDQMIKMWGIDKDEMAPIDGHDEV